MSEIRPEFAAARGNLIHACSEMERMLAGLDDVPGVAEQIHEVRKLGKRLRGGLTVIGEAKPCIRWIAVIGQMLGGSRDAAVRVKTWKSLGIETAAPACAEAAIQSLLELEAHAASLRPPREVVDWSLAALGQVKARLEARTDEEVAQLAEKGVQHLKKQLKKRLKRTLQRVDNQDFHDCRKAAKSWLGGLSLVAPELEIPGKDEAKKLADNLGDENDLEVLARWMTERNFTRAVTRIAWKYLLKRQERIRRISISLIRKELLPALGSKE